VSYCTPAQLVQGTERSRSLAQLMDIVEPLLLATIAGSDRSEYSADEIAAADAALATIEAELARATGEIDARLAKRGYPLPQSSAQFPILTTWARSIARYHLHSDRSGEGANVVDGRYERDYLDARDALGLVAAGKLSLGAGDPLAVPASSGDDGAIRVTSQPRMFSRDRMGGL
jgi:phage gp36-like protein